MNNENTGNRQQGNQDSSTGGRTESGSQKSTYGPNQWNDQNQVVNEQEQNRPVNTGDEDYKENVTGRTPEEPPKDLNLSGSNDENSSDDTEGGAEIETPHKKEGDDETNTERKLPRM